MRGFLLLAGLIFTNWISGQDPASTGKVSISVFTSENVPLEGATIELLRSKDSALVRTAITDKLGKAEIENLLLGTYLLKASMVNFLHHYVAVTVSQEQPFITLESIKLLNKPATQLKDVTVTANKPFIQRLTDRIVVNVESSIISAGSTAFDVLERSPGVLINNNEQIELRGRQGVIIMIDGRPSPLGGADLVNYLRSLPSSAIDRIEIITNPSAKYDAAGNSGIIDIKMKKDQRLGTNGTLSAGYGQGVYPKANAGATLNYRNKKVNVFGNYNYNYRKNLNHLLLDRNFYNNGIFTGYDTKDNYMTSHFNAHNIRAGADYYPSAKTIIGVVINTNMNAIKAANDNEAIVYDVRRAPVFKFNTDANSQSKFGNTFGNLNFKHTFDSTGKELTADVDYGVFNNSALSNTITSYFATNGSVLQPAYTLNGDQDGDLTITSFKVDYVHPMRKKDKIEAGIKASIVSSDNDVKFFDVSSGSPVNDQQKTNRFFYDENINAAYLNYNKQFKSWGMQLGLRAEQTNIKGRQVVGNVHFDSTYLQLFPSAFLTYNIAKEQTLGFSVSRRIDRPGYSQLNPFQFLIDVTLYSTGNTRLLPQFTWSYEMSYTVKQLNFTLGYSHTKQNMTTAILRYNDVFPNNPVADNVTVQIPLNLESSDYIGLNIAAPVRISKWWNMMNNADLFYIHFNSNIANTPLNNGTPSARVSINNNFTFKKGWGAELGFNYNAPGRSGYMEFKSSWGLSAGVQKSVLKNKGTVRLNITDIFWTNLPRAVITYGNYIENWKAYRETRVANLTFQYRFGNNKVQGARKRTTASEEERRRAG